MHLCRNLFASFQRDSTSNLGGLHTVFSHGFCNEFAAGLHGGKLSAPYLGIYHSRNGKDLRLGDISFEGLG